MSDIRDYKRSDILGHVWDVPLPDTHEDDEHRCGHSMNFIPKLDGCNALQYDIVVQYSKGIFPVGFGLQLNPTVNKPNKKSNKL